MTHSAVGVPLSEVPVFAGVEPQRMREIEQLASSVRTRAGTTLITADHPGDTVYVITSGAAKVHVEQPGGRDVILSLLGPGEVIGEMSVADSLGRSATVRTMEPTTLYWISRAQFRRWMLTTPRISENLLGILSRRLRRANARIQSLATLDVYGRVAHELLSLSEEYGRTDTDGGTVIPIRLTQSDLADLVGASRVRVNQVLVDYRQQGYIATSPDHILSVLDADGLASRVV